MVKLYLNAILSQNYVLLSDIEKLAGVLIAT